MEQFGLVALDLEQIIAALPDDGAGVGSLAVQGIGGDDLAVQGGRFFQQGRRRRLFAALGAFFLVVNGHGLGGAVLMLGEGEQADVIADHFAIQSQRLRQGSAVALQPAIEAAGKGFRVQTRQHLVEDAVAGNLIKGEGTLFNPTSATGGKGGLGAMILLGF